jgi:predicted MFS family arabinose efflux permease
MIPAGVLVDRLGVRRVVAGGGLLMGAGSLAMALAPDPARLFAGRLGVGAGAAVTFVGTLKIAAAWFPPSYFATLSAATAATGVLGGLVATAPLAWLATGLGWRGALGVIGAGTVAGALLCLALVRDRPPGAGGPAPAVPGWGAVLAGLGRVLRNPDTWPPFLAFLFLYSATNNLYFWIVPCLRDLYGLTMADAALYATAPSVALLAAGPLTGFLSDRVLRRRRLPYAALTAAQCAAWTVFVLTLGRLPPGGLYALLFAMGLVGGAFVLTWPLGREVNPPELAGIAVAVVNLGAFIGAALTQGPLGALLDARWAGATLAGARVYPVGAYRASFGASAVLILAASVTSLLFRETRGQNVYARPS